jgi:hypothetical protein
MQILTLSQVHVIKHHDITRTHILIRSVLQILKFPPQTNVVIVITICVRCSTEIMPMYFLLLYFIFPLFWDCEHTETDIWAAVDSHSLLNVVIMRSDGYKLLMVLLEEAK